MPFKADSPLPIEIRVTSNVLPMKYVKRYNPEITVGQLKENLKCVVGAEPSNMRLELWLTQSKLPEANAIIEVLEDDDATLAEAGVKHKSTINVIDTKPDRASAAMMVGLYGGGINKWLDSKPVEKYVMSDCKYEKKKDSMRVFKREAKKKRIEMDIVESKAAAEQWSRDQRVLFGEHKATIKYIGETSFKHGTWVGLLLDEPVGKNNGNVKGVSYFNCSEKHGKFVRPDKIKKLPESKVDAKASSDVNRCSRPGENERSVWRRGWKLGKAVLGEPKQLPL